MNKDLGWFSAIWRALFGVRIDRFYCLFSYCQRAAENGFAADFGSVSGDGRSFRCQRSRRILSGIAIWCLCCRYKKNVMKERGCELATRAGMGLQVCSPQRKSPSLETVMEFHLRQTNWWEQCRLFGRARSRKAREGAHPPTFFVQCSGTNSRIYFPIEVAHAPSADARSF